NGVRAAGIQECKAIHQEDSNCLLDRSSRIQIWNWKSTFLLLCEFRFSKPEFLRTDLSNLYENSFLGFFACANWDHVFRPFSLSVWKDSASAYRYWVIQANSRKLGGA